jgi:hypothetical protein
VGQGALPHREAILTDLLAVSAHRSREVLLVRSALLLIEPGNDHMLMTDSVGLVHPSSWTWTEYVQLTCAVN